MASDYDDTNESDRARERIGAKRRRRKYGRPKAQAADQLDLVNIDAVQESEVDWLWSGRVPLGMVTIVGGDPGDGKSYFSLALACAVSRGGRLDGDDRGPTTPRNVVIANFEDTPENVIKKRIRLIGKGQAFIHLINGVIGADGHRRPFAASDLPALEKVLAKDQKVQLVIIDPVGDYVGGKVNTSSDNEVRGALVPLVDAARRLNIAILVVMHLRKAEAERILYRLAGSAGGFSGVARSVLLVGKEPESGRRAIVHLKCNVGPLVDPVEFGIDDDGFHFKGVAADLTAEMMVGSADRRGQKGREALKWLAARLDPPGTSVLQSVIQRESALAGHRWHTIRRAADDLGVGMTQDRDQHGRAKPSEWFIDPEGVP